WLTRSIRHIVGCSVSATTRRTCFARRSSARRIVRPGVGGGQAARHQRADDLYLAQAFRRLGANEVRRLKQLGAENARRDLEIELMKEVAACLRKPRIQAADGRPHSLRERQSDPRPFIGV